MKAKMSAFLQVRRAATNIAIIEGAGPLCGALEPKYATAPTELGLGRTVPVSLEGNHSAVRAQGTCGDL